MSASREHLAAKTVGEVTKYVLETCRLFSQRSFAIGDEHDRDMAATQIADLTLAIASELADRLQEHAPAETPPLDPETQEAIASELAPPSRQPRASNPITDLLSRPSGISAEAQKLLDMRAAKHRGSSSTG